MPIFLIVASGDIVAFIHGADGKKMKDVINVLLFEYFFYPIHNLDNKRSSKKGITEPKRWDFQQEHFSYWRHNSSNKATKWWNRLDYFIISLKTV